MNRARLSLTLMLALLAAPGLFMTAPVQAQEGLRFQTDPDAPLALQADKMQWQQKQGVADLTGSVAINQGPMQVTAETMQVMFAAGGAAQSMAARGNVLLVNKDGQRARAEAADFDLEKDIMVMRGSVAMQGLTRKGKMQKLTGETLSINMLTGKATLRGGKSRARIEIDN